LGTRFLTGQGIGQGLDVKLKGTSRTKKRQQKQQKNYHNHKTKHNSVHTFCRTPDEHLQEPKKKTTKTTKIYQYKTKQ